MLMEKWNAKLKDLFRCDDCGRVFKSISHLGVHMVSHRRDTKQIKREELEPAQRAAIASDKVKSKINDKEFVDEVARSLLKSVLVNYPFPERQESVRKSKNIHLLKEIRTHPGQKASSERIELLQRSVSNTFQAPPLERASSVPPPPKAPPPEYLLASKSSSESNLAASKTQN